MLQQYSGPVVSILLRDGTTLNVFSDRLETEGQAFGMRMLARAWLSSYPAEIAGQPASPAVGVELRGGRSVVFIPADPPDASRALEAIYALRPDLRSSRGSRGLARASDGPRPVQDHHERIVAVIAHLSVFYAPLLLPLIFWLTSRQTMPYAARQARQAFLFNLGVLLLIALDGGVCFAVLVATGVWTSVTNSTNPLGAGIFVLFLGGLVALGLVVTSLVSSIIGAIQSLRGLAFSYPLMRRW